MQLGLHPRLPHAVRLQVASNSLKSGQVGLGPAVQGEAPHLADVRAKVPVNPAAIDADEDAEVETRPVGVLATTIRTLGVAGQAPDPLQVRLAITPGPR